MEKLPSDIEILKSIIIELLKKVKQLETENAEL